MMLYLSSAAVSVAERSPFSGTAGTILGTIIAAVVTGTAMYLVARVGRRTGKESGEWQRIEGLWDRVDELEGKVEKLQTQNRTQSTRMTDLEAQNGEHERKISGLERWKDAALRYIASLIKAITDLGGTPPDPPPDYIDPR